MAVAAPLIKQGWLRVLLFLIAWMAVSYFADTGLDALLSAGGNTAVEPGDNWQTLLRFFVAALTTTLVVWLWRKLIDRKEFKSLGFAFEAFKNDAGIGFFAAPAIIGIGSLILAALKYLQFDGVALNPLSLLTATVLMVLVAYAEELVIRGYMLNNLLQSFNKWVALVLSSAFFALMHLANPDVSAVSLINILAAGLLLGINYIYTKNLWFGIFLHFSWNFFQGPVFGFEVSGIQFNGIFQQTLFGPTLWTGGNFGFEGSLLCPLLTLAATSIFGWHFSRKYAPTIQV